jgi:hypothetical protein
MRCVMTPFAVVVIFASSTASAQNRPGFRDVGGYAPGSASWQPVSSPGAARSMRVQPVTHWNSPGCDSPASCHQPDCEPKVCRLHTSTEKIKKTCFEVKCEAVCVPPVTFPWEKSPCDAGCDCAPACAASRCARVKYVTVPLIREYECGEKCVCEWKLEDACLGSPPEKVPEEFDAVPAAPDEADSHPARASPSLAIRPAAGRRSVFGWLRLGSRN